MVKIYFDIPREMLEAAKSDDIQSKPHNLCFYCPAHTVTCSGANEMALSVEDFVDRTAKLAKQKGVSRQRIADDSGLPFPTVVSVMSKRTADPRHSTLQAISRSVNGGCWGTAPCYMASLLLSGQITAETVDVDEEHLAARNAELEERIKEANVYIEKLEQTISNIHISYKQEFDEIRTRTDRVVEYLKAQTEKLETRLEEKDRIIAKLLLKD